MSASITRKRARLESDVDQDLRSASPGAEHSGRGNGRGSGSGSGAELQGKMEDQEFWYRDGNIILVAGDVKFRVFKGILAERSAVFKDMFSLPQPPDEPSHDAPCPVVHLTDSPHDLRHLLRIYMPQDKPKPFGEHHPTFDTLSATIRLGHKYQFTELVEHSVAYLKEYYPADFKEWVKYRYYSPPNFGDWHAIGVINLARLVGEFTLLPTAFLACCTLDAEIVHGFLREDGLREQLTLEDVGRCFEAKTALFARCISSADRVFDPQTSCKCQDTITCKKALRNMLEGLRGRGKWLSVADPLRPYAKMYSNVAQVLCGPCYRMVEARDKKEQRVAWDRLPEIFNIEIEGWGRESEES